MKRGGVRPHAPPRSAPEVSVNYHIPQYIQYLHIFKQPEKWRFMVATSYTLLNYGICLPRNSRLHKGLHLKELGVVGCQTIQVALQGTIPGLTGASLGPVCSLTHRNDIVNQLQGLGIPTR